MWPHTQQFLAVDSDGAIVDFKVTSSRNHVVPTIWQISAII